MSVVQIKLIKIADELTEVWVPLIGSPIPAGFPSPADDYIEKDVDINSYLIEHKEATLLAYAFGDSMNEIGIMDGSMIVIDRSKQAKDGDIAYMILNGDRTVKQLLIKDKTVILNPLSHDKRFKALTIEEFDELRVLGIVTGVVTKL